VPGLTRRDEYNATDDPTKIDIRFDPREQHMEGTTMHGNKYFDVPFISEVTENLWQGGCANGLVLPDHIQHLVSLYPWEAYTVKHELKSYLMVKMYDSEDQAFDQVDGIAAWVNCCRADGVTTYCSREHIALDLP
jgi:hypothetical protein